MTVRDLIRLALIDLQVLAAGEAIPAPEAQDSLVLLNGLLESWNLDSLWVFVIDRVVQPLTVSQASYTIGTGGDFAMVRPHRIDAVAWREGSTALEIPVALLTDGQFQALRLKTLASLMPCSAYYNPAYPLASLHLWPVPQAGHSLVLYVWHQITTFASLDTVITLPPGYERALRANLALELAPAFSATPSPLLLGIALDAKGLLARQNTRIEPLDMDAALHPGGAYDWRTDTGG